MQISITFTLPAPTPAGANLASDPSFAIRFADPEPATTSESEPEPELPILGDDTSCKAMLRNHPDYKAKSSTYKTYLSSHNRVLAFCRQVDPEIKCLGLFMRDHLLAFVDAIDASQYSPKTKQLTWQWLTQLIDQDGFGVKQKLRLRMGEDAFEQLKEVAHRKESNFGAIVNKNIEVKKETEFMPDFNDVCKAIDAKLPRFSEEHMYATLSLAAPMRNDYPGMIYLHEGDVQLKDKTKNYLVDMRNGTMKVNVNVHKTDAMNDRYVDPIIDKPTADYVRQCLLHLGRRVGDTVFDKKRTNKDDFSTWIKRNIMIPLGWRYNKKGPLVCLFRKIVASHMRAKLLRKEIDELEEDNFIATMKHSTDAHIKAYVYKIDPDYNHWLEAQKDEAAATPTLTGTKRARDEAEDEAEAEAEN